MQLPRLFLLALLSLQLTRPQVVLAQPSSNSTFKANFGSSLRVSESTTARKAETAWVYDKQASALIPLGLFPVTAEVIKENYTGKSVPQHVFKNRIGDCSIAFNFMKEKLAPSEIASMQSELKEKIQSKISGVQWLSDHMTSVKGRQWAILKFKSPTEGYLVSNWILISSWKGRVIEIVVSSMDDAEGANDVQVNDFVQSLSLTGP